MSTVYFKANVPDTEKLVRSRKSPGCYRGFTKGKNNRISHVLDLQKVEVGEMKSSRNLDLGLADNDVLGLLGLGGAIVLGLGGLLVAGAAGVVKAGVRVNRGTTIVQKTETKAEPQPVIVNNYNYDQRQFNTYNNYDQRQYNTYTYNYNNTYNTQIIMQQQNAVEQELANRLMSLIQYRNDVSSFQIGADGRLHYTPQFIKEVHFLGTRENLWYLDDYFRTHPQFIMNNRNALYNVFGCNNGTICVPQDTYEFEQIFLAVA